MPRLIKTFGGALDLWLVGVASEEGPSASQINLLSADEMDRADRFHFAVDRTRFILTRAALRTLLGQATGAAPKELAFSTGSYGKPRIEGGPGLHFNVSHSGALALIGISSECPIGVDIEVIRENRDELTLASAFFREDEYQFLARLQAQARLDAFYRIWTAKEAVLKAFGVGISANLKDFSVQIQQEGLLVQPAPGCFTPSLANLRIEPVEVPAGYAGAVVLARS